MNQEFSRHTNEQHRWAEALVVRIRELDGNARHWRWTHAEYLDRRAALFASEPRLTRDRGEYCRGYERALSDARWRELHHCYRIAGRPDTATAAKWNDMPEFMRQACRDNTAESTHCWDTEGRFPYGVWTV